MCISISPNMVVLYSVGSCVSSIIVRTLNEKNINVSHYTQSVFGTNWEYKGWIISVTKTFYPKTVRNIFVVKWSFICQFIAMRETIHKGETWGLPHVKRTLRRIYRIFACVRWFLRKVREVRFALQWILSESRIIIKLDILMNLISKAGRITWG